jgi:predicted enzyme related to lactoylglutathione lyase
MGTRTSYPPGTFSWVDLATADVTAASAFYGDLFGWDTDDVDGATYRTCRLDGDAVCGLSELPAAARTAGVPSSWTSYVTVPDADAAAERATELGGVVTEAPADVGDFGRTAALADPQGAALAVWQPGARIGAERVNDVGCLCMNELATTDLRAASAFYEGLFGWTTEPFVTGADGPEILLALNGGKPNASLLSDAGPPHWRPNFTVESTEAAAARVGELGGTVVVEPMGIPDGSIALVRDPQGSLFALFAGETDP